MAKTKETPDKKKVSPTKLIDQVMQHHHDADYSIQTLREDWDDKEAILVGRLTDDISENSAKSQVFDPRLSTIIYERGARVMAQNPTGKAMAISKDDIGKNKLMNLLLDRYVAQNANYQMDYLIKDRLWDIYSQVYGVMFQLVDWVVDPKAGYVGPNSWVLPIRDVFPQPGKVSVEDCDWVQVSTLKSIQWLESRDKDEWQNIDTLIEKLRESKGKTKESYPSERRSEVEETRHPTIAGDKIYPQVEILTEYRQDKWITFAKDFQDVGILREKANPHKNNKIPIVAKHAFPLIDSIWGLGEVERGKTLQFAINSLINLYLDGVKMSIFPPIQINPNAQGLVPSTIKMGAAEKWFVGRPNVDIQQMQLNPQGISTFQQTYQFLVAALLNQAGTTDTTIPAGVDYSQGKTPEALKQLAQRENSRDSWDRFMLERALEKRNKLFIELFAEKLNVPITLRLFGAEIEDIQKSDPDVVEMFKSGDRGTARVTKKAIAAKYDYEIEPMSTLKSDPEEEMKSLLFLFNLVMQSPQVLQMLPQQAQQLGKEPMTIDLTELFKKIVVGSKIQDWDKVLVPAQGGDNVSQLSQEAQQGPPEAPSFQDPDIAKFAQQLQGLGGQGEVPATPQGVQPDLEGGQGGF